MKAFTSTETFSRLSLTTQNAFLMKVVKLVDDPADDDSCIEIVF